MKIVKIILVSIAVVILGVAGFLFLILTPPLFPEQQEARFQSQDGKTTIVLTNTKRVRFGGETCTRVQVEENGYASNKHVVDHNGRMLTTSLYTVDISRDRNWIRTCLHMRTAAYGILEWEENAYDHGNDWMRGSWKVRKPRDGEAAREYSFRCDAFVNYKTNRLIRRVYPNSTREQRESLMFAAKETGNMEDTIDGETVTWEPAIKLSVTE